MTHTLHPEIEKANPKLRDELLALGMSLERAWADEKWHITMANLVRERLWPYLLPPSQHLKDKPTITEESIQESLDEIAKWETTCINPNWEKITDEMLEKTLWKDNEPLPEKFPMQNKELKKEIRQFRTSLQAYPDILWDEEQFYLLFKEYFYCFITKPKEELIRSIGSWQEIGNAIWEVGAYRTFAKFEKDDSGEREEQ